MPSPRFFRAAGLSGCGEGVQRPAVKSRRSFRRRGGSLRATLSCRQLANRIGIDRSREVVALSFVAAERGDKLHLFFGLDAFRDDVLFERGAETRDRA